MAVTAATIAGGVASAASAASSIKSMSGGGGKGGAPKWQVANNKKYAQQAGSISKETADFTQDQLDAQQGVRDLQGMGQEDLAAAQARAEGFAGGVTPEQIQQYMNPYKTQVVDAYLNELGQMRAGANQQVSERAQKAGAFGGDREAVYRASIQGDLDRTGATTLADLNYRGYDMATRTALDSARLGQAGNAQVMDIINNRRSASYGDLMALEGSGRSQQALEQARLDAPMETLRFRSDINNAGNYGQAQGGQRGDPVAAGLAGFQSGVQGVQGAINTWQSMFPRQPAAINAPTGPVNVVADRPVPIQTDWGFT